MAELRDRRHLEARNAQRESWVQVAHTHGDCFGQDIPSSLGFAENVSIDNMHGLVVYAYSCSGHAPERGRKPNPFAAWVSGAPHRRVLAELGYAVGKS